VCAPFGAKLAQTRDTFCGSVDLEGGGSESPTRVGVSACSRRAAGCARTLPGRVLENAFVEIRTTDYHTAGEPFRIVEEGLLDVPGESVRARRERASASDEVERVRRLLCHEPRGHADMYGCFLVPPDDDGADLGVLFWHKDGFSTACGHGTIALGAWAVESGRVAAPDDGEVDVTIDVPSGRVVARVRRRGGAVESVTFRNVPSYVVARGVAAGGVEVDVAYGGAIYAFAPAERFGLHVAPGDVSELIAVGRRVKHALEGSEVACHADDDRLSGIYGTVLYEELGPLHQRNVAIFADGEVDRSPTGSATSARTALLVADGALVEGQTWRNDSIVGTTFHARAIGTAAGGLLTEVEGTAFRTGEHRFFLDPRDTLGTGFVLR
jgi:proline racemase